MMWLESVEQQVGDGAGAAAGPGAPGERGGSQNLPVEVSEGLIWCWELIRGVTSRGER